MVSARRSSGDDKSITLFKKWSGGRWYMERFMKINEKKIMV